MDQGIIYRTWEVGFPLGPLQQTVSYNVDMPDSNADEVLLGFAL